MPDVKDSKFEFDFVQRTPGSVRRQPHAMRILILGDFSGRAAQKVPEGGPRVRERSAVRVDVDNFEDVLWRFSPRIRVPALKGAGTDELEIRSLEDFHPDSIYLRLPGFKRLRETRRRLEDPGTFAAAASELQDLLSGVSLEEKPGTKGHAERATQLEESDAEAIERLLGRPTSSAPGTPSDRYDKGPAVVSKLIRRIVAPHMLTEQSGHREVYLQTVDAVVGERMRTILHAPEFQSVESSWRSVYGLVAGLETDESLQIHLLDLSKQELAVDLAAAREDLSASGLYRDLIETGPGMPDGEPWSLLVGDFRFDPSSEDIDLLAALGAVASHAGGPFLAAASSQLLGCRSIAETPDPSDWEPLPQDTATVWKALRRSPVARWLGLALPRVLLRLPYGKETEPVDGFDFEELVPERRHEAYLWGNPAFVCASLIGRAYSVRGWSMAPGDELEMDDLPAHVYQEEGEKRLQACAEAYLSERAAIAILDRGLMPLLSLKRRNSLRLARFQSIADPSAPLAGPSG
ncbi:MAG: type VI secretion system contractile sheath large subunit [Pseudomonadota bacterium]|nr:type VI secretion system contractile sheath large subunit [Pseudomonadota bacterium]